MDDNPFTHLANLDRAIDRVEENIADLMAAVKRQADAEGAMLAELREAIQTARNALNEVLDDG